MAELSNEGRRIIYEALYPVCMAAALPVMSRNGLEKLARMLLAQNADLRLRLEMEKRRPPVRKGRK
jgi:hypothetical protein